MNNFKSYRPSYTEDGKDLHISHITRSLDLIIEMYLISMLNKKKLYEDVKNEGNNCVDFNV